jgi:carbon monoxide dehydrogenase subunit G
MTLQSQSYTVNAAPKDVITFLSDAKNLFHILPQDKITDWTADEQMCSFKVQGGFTIRLLEDGNNGSNELYLKSGEGTPFSFKLTVFLNEKESKTEGHIHFDGEVNLFLKMMVEKPLTALFDYMSKQLVTYYA